MNQKARTKTLYLHMGPGFHSGVEREVFASRFSFVAFPDQPADIGFEELLNWCDQQVDLLFAQNGNQKIDIVAHSFGGQLLKHLTKTSADKIRNITLVNSAFDSFKCFERMARALDTPALLNNATAEEKLNFILQLTTNSRFGSLYWMNNDTKQDYESKVCKHPTLNVPTFIEVFTGYLNRQKNFDEKQKNSFHGQVRFFYSPDDVLLDAKEDLKKWTELFPQLEAFEIVGSGHHLLHERPDLAENIFT